MSNRSIIIVILLAVAAFLVTQTFYTVDTTKQVLVRQFGAIFGEPNFDDLTFTLNGAVFTYGAFLSAVVTFVLIALVLFLIVKVVIRVMGETAEKTSCPSCLEEVLIAASRCPHCTSELTPTIE